MRFRVRVLLVSLVLIECSGLGWGAEMRLPPGPSQQAPVAPSYTLRLTNLCQETHRFEITDEAFPSAAEQLLVAAGSSREAALGFPPAGPEPPFSSHLRVRVTCSTCPQEPGCGPRVSFLHLEPPPGNDALWDFRPGAVVARQCEAAWREQPDIAQLYLERLDARACLGDQQWSDTALEPAPAARAFLEALERRWIFRLSGGELSINQLDGGTGFSSLERFLLSFLSSDPSAAPEPIRADRIPRPFYVAVLLDLLRSGSQPASPLENVSSEWVSAVLSAVSRLARGQSPFRSTALRPRERENLPGIVTSLASRAGLSLPLSPRPAYLPGVERVELEGGFDPAGFDWRSRGELGHPLQSFAAFQRDALYGSFGYYTTEHALIGRTGHFETIPQKAFPVFGGLIGELAVRTFQRLGSPNSFVIREDGGGRGELARGALLYLQTRALLQPDSPHAELWNRLRFEAVEISPVRVEEQRREIGHWEGLGILQPGRFRITQADATRFLTEPTAGLTVSNELIDVLPVQKFYVEDSGRLFLVCPIPYFAAGKDRERRLREVWGGQYRAFRRESREFSDQYRLPQRDSRIYLTNPRFEQVQEWLRAKEKSLLPAGPSTRPEQLQKLVPWLPKFLEGLIPVELIPELHQLVAGRQADLLGGLVHRGETESEAYLELVKNEYLSTVYQSLSRGGALVVDYMNPSPVPNNTALLTYGETRSEGRWADPYVGFGLQDITLPPDAISLAREARRSGWKFERLDPQEALLELAGAHTDPHSSLAMLAGHARLLGSSRLSDPEVRREFDQWLIGLARRQSSGEGLLGALQRDLPERFQSALDESALVKLRRTLDLLRPGVRWEPENPNFFLIFLSKGLLPGPR